MSQLDSISRAMVAIFARMTWCSTKRFPKVLRRSAWRVASSRHRRAHLVACTDSTSLSWLKLVTMYLKPLPSSPIILLSGTRTSSSVTNVVFEVSAACVSSFRTWSPGVSAGTSTSDMPAMPGPPVRTAITNHDAHSPFEIHFFWPLIRKDAPSSERTALARIALTSEPAVGSEMARHMNFSPRMTGGATSRRIASDPCSSTGGSAIEFIASPPMTPGTPMRASSSHIMTSWKASKPSGGVPSYS
mmetsp:Transcript_13571/g.56790  ORF Transcript_13571/g.56790 Transcript_13571/m.56790 type:complete len:245 (+) Transcript_13571:444-1178(+)